MFIWILFALMTAALLAALLRPLLASPPAPRQVVSSVDVYRAQLAELEVERAAGRLADPEYQAARAEVGRRLLKASEAKEEEASAPAAKRTPLLAYLLVAAVPAVALPLYLAIGSPDDPDQPLSSRGAEIQRAHQLEQLMTEFEAKLKSGKGDAAGWIMFGSLKSKLGDFTAAIDAFTRALGMIKASGKPVPADLYVALGEAEMAKAQGQVTPRAADAFRAALALEPKQVSARFYLALGKQNAGDLKGALADYEALLAETPAGSPDRKFFEDRIQALKPQVPK